MCLRVSVGNDSVKTNLVEVGGLKLQHLVDAGSVDGVGSILDFLRGIIAATETSGDELLAVLVEKIEGRQVSASRDLDQLCKSVTDLSIRQSAEETKVKEGVHRSVVSTETVLVVAVVDGDLDGDRSINQTDDSGGDTDVVGVSTVCGTSETANS